MGNLTFVKQCHITSELLQIITPRDRNGTFEPQLIRKGQTRITEFDCVFRLDPNANYGNIRTPNPVLFERRIRFIRTLITALIEH